MEGAKQNEITWNKTEKMMLKLKDSKRETAI